MISQREVIRRYEQLKVDVATKDFYKVDLKNRVNCYCCRVCNNVTKTKDVDAGVTPMFIKCDKCHNTMNSTMYSDVRPDMAPNKEWYRPSIKEVLHLRNKPEMMEHVLSGGLMLRNVIKAEKIV